MGVRWLRRAAVGVAVLGLLVVAAGWPVYVQPRAETVSVADPADAIVILGGLPEAAVFGYRLYRDDTAATLVVSNPYGPPPWAPLAWLCPAEPWPEVSCFAPAPSTTRGEAQEIGRLAARNGWDDVVVVAPTFHVSRARMIISRCYTGRLRMVEYPAGGLRTFPYQYAYQTAGFVKASVLRSC